MYYYQLKLAYEGSDFEGWQKQPHSRATVQGSLEQTLKELFPKDKNIHTLGSGRTDAGVHALGQVVKLTLSNEIPLDGLKKAINGKVSKQIRVLEVKESREDFHPIQASKSKEYRYYLLPSKEIDPFMWKTLTYWPHSFDLSRAQEVVELFKGHHDFCNYYTTGSDVKSTKREIFVSEAYLYENDPSFSFSFPKGTICFQFEGNGFLKQMVRCLVGAALCYAKGEISLSEIEESLKKPLQKRIGLVAPPNGLYMYRVNYS